MPWTAANEIHNTIAAAEAGVAPRVVQTVPEWDVFALEWLDARTMSNETLRADGMPSRIAAALRRAPCRSRGSATTSTCSGSPSDTWRSSTSGRSRSPPAIGEHLALIPRIEAALGVHPPATVPCHNDLLAENYLDDGERLWLVDWEYSGNNDPAFELGNTAQELGFDDAQVEELCAAYFGEASPALLARMRLQMIMSDVGWTLWAAIQARISTIDYDFTGWAEERWARADTRARRAGLRGLARTTVRDMSVSAVGPSATKAFPCSSSTRVVGPTTRRVSDAVMRHRALGSRSAPGDALQVLCVRLLVRADPWAPDVRRIRGDAALARPWSARGRHRPSCQLCDRAGTDGLRHYVWIRVFGPASGQLVQPGAGEHGWT